MRCISERERQQEVINDEQTQAVTAYWDKKNALRYEKYKAKNKLKDQQRVDEIDSSSEQDTADDNWKSQLLDQIKEFSSTKFESFSRLLISKMGVKIDKYKGIKLSGIMGLTVLVILGLMNLELAEWQFNVRDIQLV